MLSLPQILDAVLGLIVLELIVLSIWLMRQSKAALIAPLAAFLASGACLMLTLRLTIDPADNQSLVLGLITLSFPAHLAALVLAWRNISKH